MGLAAPAAPQLPQQQGDACDEPNSRQERDREQLSAGPPRDGLAIAGTSPKQGLAAPLPQQRGSFELGQQLFAFAPGACLRRQQGGGDGGGASGSSAEVLEDGLGLLGLPGALQQQRLLEQELRGWRASILFAAADRRRQALLEGLQGIAGAQERTDRFAEVALGEHRQLELTPTEVIANGGALQAGDQPVQPEQKAQGQADEGEG